MLANDVASPLIDNPAAGAGAFFDLEKTLTPHAVEQVTALEFYRRGELSLAQVARVAWIYVRYDLGFIANFDAMKRSGAPVFAGREAANDASTFLDWFNASLKASIFPEALEVVAACRAAGVPVFLVSATYSFMVRPYAEHFGARDFVSAELEVEDGRCTGNIAGVVPHQEEKAAAVRALALAHGLDLRASYAFGDSMNDAAMLGAVGHAFVVNPGRKLRALAEKQGWTVLRWGR